MRATTTRVTMFALVGQLCSIGCAGDEQGTNSGLGPGTSDANTGTPLTNASPGSPSSQELAEVRAAASPVLESDYCSTLDLLICDAIQACCSDSQRKYVDRTECLVDVNACDDTAIAEAIMPYDAQQAGELVEVFRRTTTACELPFPRLYFAQNAGGFATNGAVAISTSAVDEPRCMPGCSVDEYCSGATCVARLGEGQECTNEGDAPCTQGLSCWALNIVGSGVRTCAAAPSLGGPCEYHKAGCPEGLTCRYVTGLDGSGSVCAPLGAETDDCLEDQDCESELYCDFEELRRCARPQASGAVCVRGSGCASNLCAERVCAMCQVHADCSDQYCIESACVPKGDVIGVFEDGVTCQSDENCKSGFCASGTCITPTPDEIYCPAVAG